MHNNMNMKLNVYANNVQQDTIMRKIYFSTPGLNSAHAFQVKTGTPHTHTQTQTHTDTTDTHTHRHTHTHTHTSQFYYHLTIFVMQKLHN